MRSKHSGDQKAQTKQKELHVHNLLQTHNMPFAYQKFIPIDGCGLQGGTKHAFLDFVIPRRFCTVLLEKDENQHKYYTEGCDLAREMNVLASIAMGSADKVVFLRYNPDVFRVGGHTQRTSRKQREDKLVQVLRDLDQELETHYARLFLFFDRQSPESVLPLIADGWPDQVKEISRCLA